MFERGKTGPKSVLNLEQQSALKLGLWNGVPHRHLADEFGMAASYMPQVTSGRVLAQVPWPDSTKGPMPQYRKDQLALDRRRQTVTQNTHGGLGPAAPGSARANMTPGEVQAMIASWEVTQELARVNRLAERQKWMDDLADKHRAEGIDVDSNVSQPYAQVQVVDYDKLARADWATLLEQYPDVGVIRLADDDELLQDAICIAAAAQNHPPITSDGFMKACAQIKKSLMQPAQ